MCPPQRHLRAFPPQITLAGGHRCTEHTLKQAFPVKLDYNLSRAGEDYKGGRKVVTLLASANTDSQEQKRLRRFEGFPPRHCVLCE